ncbi:translation elongation factor IF5A [Kipferlia bialata]|uniref:Eukaryotic translation initiation factor 5A n=1 Tax=Kipferlia bialata TaxID=797122 RepID=A0A391NZV5_9EUKA|nr:translation elongation factor IF5A [Kipferlia bialata]|eukprot:g11928.t1
MSDLEFENVDEAGGKMRPIAAGQVRKGGYVVIKGRPCKVSSLSVSKTGKHGHAKVNMTTYDIFTGKKLEDMCPSTHNMNEPVVERNDYTLIGIEDGYAHLMDEDGEVREDLTIPPETMGEEITAAFEDDKDVTCGVISALGHDQIMTFRFQ